MPAIEDLLNQIERNRAVEQAAQERILQLMDELAEAKRALAERAPLPDEATLAQYAADLKASADSLADVTAGSAPT